MRIDVTFEQWFKEVDEDMLRIAGVGTEDISDKMWRNWYKDGYTPMQAVETALMNSGFSFEENYYLG